jgi:transglutaminase-like putative cysteine protease
VRWEVNHETVYRYSVPVTFAPHVLRVTPRAERARVIAATLDTSPAPAAVSHFADAYDNPCTRVAFGSDASTVLRFESRVQVETFAPPSLAPLGLPQLPWPVAWDDALSGYRGGEGLSPDVEDFVREVAAGAGYGALAYLDRLGETLAGRIEKTIRVDGAPQRPEETFALSRGACRDITVLYLAACRKMGIAARFVSGYQGAAETIDGRRHLHAWPEVFLPGAGWVGWDPMHGIRVGEDHIALCVAPGQDGTMPVEGGFYFEGPEVTSTLEYAIRIARF